LPSVIFLNWQRCANILCMTHLPQPNSLQRATRVNLGESVLALVKRDSGQRAKAKLQTVSLTGGLLCLARAFEEGDFVEVAFQTQSGPVHGMAEMLHPRQISAQTILQAFRFVALEDDDHNTLSFAVNSTNDRNFLLGSNQYSS
jgi:hypothetical protein